MKNVQENFKSLQSKGTASELKFFENITSLFKSNYDPTLNHVQGHTQYTAHNGTSYSILTHSVSSASYAHIVCGVNNTSKIVGYKTYLKNWLHPGGIQAIGDYLLVPSESDSEAKIALYDLRTLEIGELRKVETFELEVNHTAGSLGITEYTDSTGKAYYLLVVGHLSGEDSVYHIYRAPVSDGLENAKFSKVESVKIKKDFQGLGLVTEADTGNVYMIGLLSVTSGATYADHAYLYKLDTEKWSIGDFLQDKHLTSVGGLAGVAGIHFRYGAGVYVNKNQKLVLSATQRNKISGSSLSINTWTAK